MKVIALSPVKTLVAQHVWDETM